MVQDILDICVAICLINCSSRILVQSGIHDSYVEELGKAVSRLKLGDPFQEGVNQGPLINEPAMQKVLHHIGGQMRNVEVNTGLLEL